MKQEFPWKTFKGGGQDQVRGPFRIARSPLLKEKMWIYLGELEAPYTSAILRKSTVRVFDKL